MAGQGRELRDVNLFAGAGGLALGLRLAGFGPALLYEIDETAIQTLKWHRLLSPVPPEWENHRGDVTQVDWSDFPFRVRLLAAGVPCQPFSLGGKHLAQGDDRNHFPDLVRAVRELQPDAVVVENVQGLLRSAFSEYLAYILSALGSPAIAPKRGELWQDHHRLLKAYEASRSFVPQYNVKSALLNAADYGVPQVRRRVFIVGVRAGLPEYSFPEPTHSRAALVRAQLSGDYRARRSLRCPPWLRLLLPREPEDDGLQPWVTVRDRLGLLPPPAMSEADAGVNGGLPNHWKIPGARSYDGHMGSVWDWPAKTIKAGVHGVPGGENILRVGPKTVRYFTLRETAVLQSFPVNYHFEGARLRVTRQVGNAVPPLLASAVARQLMHVLGGDSQQSKTGVGG